MRYGQLVLTIAIGLASESIAQEPRTTIGVLTCTLTESSGDRASKMACGFKPSGIAPEEKYAGSVQGLPPQVVGKQVLVWAVVGPANTKQPSGLLVQRYSKVKVAGHPPSWVGEVNSAIVLQFETHEDSELGNSIIQVHLELSGTSA
jgi:Protein of unknown function (DUF992)